MNEEKKTWKTDLKKEMIMVKLIKGTMSHNREKCDCEGCHCWALVGTITQYGRLFQVVKDWKCIDKDEHLRAFQRILQYRMDKKISKKKLMARLKKKGIVGKAAEEMVKRTLQGMFIVMYRAPPMGMLRDI